MTNEIRFEHSHVEGHSFRRMAVAESCGRYRFKGIGDFTIIYGFDLYPDNRTVSFRDENEVEWMRLTRRTKIIRCGYAWNGNSWKKGIRVLGKDVWLGTPDYHPGTLEASENHDTDFQFHACEHYPEVLTFERVNHHYYLLAKANKFKLAGAFHGALKDFSLAAWLHAANNTVHSVVL
jgi:hypothetical protein